jgi:hypothetical protein
MPDRHKAARGISLMEQASLNQPTPSAGSTHQRFRADRPSFWFGKNAHRICRKLSCGCWKLLGANAQLSGDLGFSSKDERIGNLADIDRGAGNARRAAR